MVLAVILAVALVGVRLVGLQVFTVLSGSMEPTYHVGSLIYVKDVDYKELEAGDVITFMLDEDPKRLGSFLLLLEWCCDHHQFRKLDSNRSA